MSSHPYSDPPQPRGDKPPTIWRKRAIGRRVIPARALRHHLATRLIATETRLHGCEAEIEMLRLALGIARGQILAPDMVEQPA